MRKFKTTELLILAFTLLIIGYSEWTYIAQGDVNKAIFIGLWPPTILAFLIYINIKTRK